MEKTIDMLGAVELAMEAEQKACSFYQAGAEKTGNPKGKALFLQLADFEQGHYDRLKALYDSLKDSGQYIRYEGTSAGGSEVEATGEAGDEPQPGADAGVACLLRLEEVFGLTLDLLQIRPGRQGGAHTTPPFTCARGSAVTGRKEAFGHFPKTARVNAVLPADQEAPLTRQRDA